MAPRAGADVFQVHNIPRLRLRCALQPEGGPQYAAFHLQLADQIERPAIALEAVQHLQAAFDRLLFGFQQDYWRARIVQAAAQHPNFKTAETHQASLQLEAHGGIQQPASPRPVAHCVAAIEHAQDDRTGRTCRGKDGRLRRRTAVDSRLGPVGVVPAGVVFRAGMRLELQTDRFSGILAQIDFGRLPGFFSSVPLEEDFSERAFGRVYAGDSNAEGHAVAFAVGTHGVGEPQANGLAAR